MRSLRSVITHLLVLGCLAVFAGSAYPQGTNLGTIRGTVTDPNGAILPNVSVKVVDQVTGLAREVTTNGEGNYEVNALKPGTYKVVVTATGFKLTEMEAVVRGSDIVRADIKTEIGPQTESVLVTGAEAGLIEKDQPVISGTLNNRQLVELPRDSREIYQFLYLNPDITQGPNGDGSFKFIGGQSYGAVFSLDGQRSNGGIFGEPTSSQPSLETIGELTVLSKNFTAEYSGIANIRIETKRGGSDYHGSLFYNNKNSALAAWTTQDKIAKANFTPTPALPTFPKPYFNLNEVGGSFGGPVPFNKGKTFFLLAYERRWDLSPLQLRSNTIPTSTIFGGNFAGIKDSSRPAVSLAALAQLTPAEIAANTFVLNGTRRFNSIPTRLLNPIAQNILNSYYPQTGLASFNATNGRLDDFVQNFPGLLTRDLATLRVDHDFSSKDKFYAVYNFQVRTGLRSFVASPLPAFGLLSQHQDNHTLSLSYTRIFSNNLVNELRGGFNIQNLFRRANQTTDQFLSGVGFNQAEIDSYGAIVGSSLVQTPGQVAFTIGPFAAIATGSRNVNRPLDQHLATFGDTVNWTRGNHSFKFGADFVRNQAVDGFAFNRNDPRGRIIYPSTLGGFADFLIGLPPSSVRYVSKVRPALDVYNWEDGFFVQDDFRITPNITLNLGLRYELITPYVDKNDLLINFDPNTKGPTGNPGRFVIPTEKVLSEIDQRFIDYGVVTAAQAGVGRGLVKTDKNNLAPRFGIAWRLNDRTVIRGGWGVFFPTSAAQGMRDAFASSAFNQRVTKTNTAALPLAGLPGGINPRGLTPFSGGRIAVQGISINAIPFDLQNPRMEQFNATFEREIGWNIGIRASYINVRQHNLIGGMDLNELPPNNIPFGITNEDGDRCDPVDAGDCTESAADMARRPFPALGSFLASYGNIGRGRSNAFQLELNRRFAAGLVFNMSYTLLDQKSSGLDVGNSSLGGAIYNQFIPTNDLSRDSFVSRHRFVSYGSYELPFGKNRAYGKSIAGWADAIAGGWDLTWNMFAKSGTGFTPYWFCDNCDPVFPGNIGSGFVDAVGDFTGPTFRPIVTGDPYANLAGGQFFNGAAFGLPPTGSDLFDNPGVAKRNFLIGPGSWGVNLGVHKFFSFSESKKLEVGADFNNVFNHPLFSPPGASGDFTDGGAGTFANLGDFLVSLNAAGQPVILPENVFRNPQFGSTNQSYTQEGIDNRRSVRLRLRFTF